MKNKVQFRRTVRKIQKVVLDCLSNKKMRNELFPDGEPDAEEFIMTMASVDIEKYSKKRLRRKKTKIIMQTILFLTLAIEGAALFYFTVLDKHNGRKFFEWLKYTWQ